jgi:hypothetical protein
VQGESREKSKEREIYMSKKSIFCIATSRDQADRIVDRLRTAKFSKHDVAVLFLDKSTSHAASHEQNGGALGWLTDIDTLAVPKVGPFIAAGPLIAAAAVAAVGGIARGLIGLGLPEPDARNYEGQVNAGHILISVHSDHWGEIPQAKDIFTKAGAHHICTAGDSAVKDNLAHQRVTHAVDPGLSATRA